MRRLPLLTAIACCLGAAPAAGAATASRTTSSNWAGYAAHGANVRFRRISGAWTVPAVDCSSATTAWSANWIGLGGYSSDAQALEQAGTESDCDARGRAIYSAWYELVPAASHGLALAVHAGDRMLASVAVSGHAARVRLADLTTGRSATRALHAALVDTSSAEWIVEAPSQCSGASDATCRVMPLANFGSTGFTNASVTPRTGRRGTIADPRWSTTAIDLSPAAEQPRGPQDQPGQGSASAGATTSALGSAGSAFVVGYRAA